MTLNILKSKHIWIPDGAKLFSLSLTLFVCLLNVGGTVVVVAVAAVAAVDVAVVFWLQHLIAWHAATFPVMVKIRYQTSSRLIHWKGFKTREN